jgi:tellurite resistance protein TerC
MPDAPPARDEAVERTARGTLMLTPLALALILVETTDLIFAVDSIPAIFAITADPFLVFTSNVFAILGLRSLYFALAGMIDKFRYLKVSLAGVLGLVGAKMLAGDWLKDVVGPRINLYVLAVILAVLTTGVLASHLANRREAREGARRRPEPLLSESQSAV